MLPPILLIKSVEYTSSIKDSPYYLVVNLLGLLSFLYIVRGYGLVSIIMRTRFLQFLGSISYSLYLWQVPVMFPIKRLLLYIFAPSAENTHIILYLFILLSTIFVFAVAYISYTLFEVRVPKYLKSNLLKYRTATS